MKTRSVLVYCPGYPIDINSLIPNRFLAEAAGCLLDAGHTTRIWDYGTVATAERLLEGKLSDLARAVGESILADTGLNPLRTLHTLWQIRASDKLFSQRLTRLCQEVADELAHMRGLHFVGLLLRSVEDMRYAAQIAQMVRTNRRKLRIVAFGPLVDLYGTSVLRGYPAFDCICLRGIELSLVGLAEKIDTPRLWSTIPNILFRDSSRIRETERRDSLSLGSHPSPAYEPDTYPALRAEQKLKLFELEDNRGKRGEGYGHPDLEPEVAVRMKPVTAVVNEMWKVATLYGARAFSLCGSAASASHMTAVAHELLRRRMDVIYSRSSAVQGDVPAMFGILKASGCASMSFIVDTGSQRLLEDYYGRAVTVSEVESILRACKASGIYTIARFTYPCPADDYHTRAETVRLVERTRPHAASVEFPQVVPQSRWFRDGAAFGYRFRPERVLSDATDCVRRFPLPPNTWSRLPVGMDGLSPSQAVAAHDELVAEFESRGILASAPANLVQLARLAGYAKREREFVSRVYEEFLTGDAAGIATLVDQFNEIACVPAKGVALHPFDSSRVAVGN